jgi:hypothetical protein
MLKTFDLRRVLTALETTGATSVPLLTDSAEQALLQEAVHYQYHREADVVGSGDRVVRQEMASFEAFPAESTFLRLRDLLQDRLARQLAACQPYPFDVPLRLNRLVLQKYDAGSLGITPHRDGKRYMNLICVVVLAGRGRFFVCEDRTGRGARKVEAAPGMAIFMRGPGFHGSQDRPFHSVSEIRETRYTFGLRQRRTDDA